MAEVLVKSLIYVTNFMLWVLLKINTVLTKV